MVTIAKTRQPVRMPRFGHRVDKTDPILRGCVGWWPLTDGTGTTAVDLSTSGNDGTASGGVTWATTAKGTAARFDGVDDIFDASPYTIGTNSSMTLTGWFRFTTTVDFATIVSICRDDGGNTAQKKRAITVNNSGLAGCSIQDGTAFATVDGTTAFAVGSWYFVAGTIVKTGTSFDVEIFVNGVSEGASSGTGTEPTPYTKTCIGAARRYNGDVTGTEPCDIQNVRIYDRALSAAEVSRLYTEPWAGLEPLSPFSFFSGLSQIYAYYSAAFLQRLG